MPQVDNDAAVRDRAYFLWEEAGRPVGREHEFWAQAAREIEGEMKSPKFAGDGRNLGR
ncbi:hypothetical protein Sa4125_24410 [Aureimonas sp. SA4125]|uniref:DUF2934 domain-containing protein n=1 Tax=Aureimonas sp. SA4125 TaxID=2826993 RepID=UPI001CC3490C|nr:DUF2934 domain-containing protein [Aureimonas sp. SA4125]BDA84899.1 hypothetical protein Sa4125_24410 [Aureimonas sp. SA4125]